MKKLGAILFCLMVIPWGASALSINDCKNLDIAYIDNLFDIKVRILKYDTSDNTCKVKILQGEEQGKTGWIKASKLMSQREKDIEDAVEQEVIEELAIRTLKWMFSDETESSKN